MAKYGYKCACGWQLRRDYMTRKDYAIKKQLHASPEYGNCASLRKELETSKKGE